MRLNVVTNLQEDGRWLAEIPDLPGVSADGETQEAAIIKAQALAMQKMADRLECIPVSVETADVPPPISRFTYIPYASQSKRQRDANTQELAPLPVKAVTLFLNFGTFFGWPF